MSFVNAGRDVWKIIMGRTINPPENLMQAILDARSRNTWIEERDLMFEAGKLRQFQATYYPPVCTDEGTCEDNVCGDAVKQEMVQRQFEMTQCTASDVYQLLKSDIRLVDGSWTFSEHAKVQMERALVAVRHKMAVSMTALIVGRIGVDKDGRTGTRLPWVNTQTGVAQPAGMDEIDRNFYDLSVPIDSTFIIGGQPVWQWGRSVDRGGLDAQGQYLNQTRTDSLYYDNLVNTVMNNGQENIIAFDPQMIKFVAFNEHAGIFRTDARYDDWEVVDRMFQFGSPERIEGTMPDPFTGLLWDLDIYYDHKADNCRGAWKMQIKLRWDILFMPSGICVNGYTGILHYTTCPRLEVACPAGSIIPPNTTDEFRAQASGISYPFLMNELTFAGQTVQFDTPVSVANIAGLVNNLNGQGFSGYTLRADGTFLEYDGYTGTTLLINGGTGNTDGYTLTFS